MPSSSLCVLSGSPDVDDHLGESHSVLGSVKRLPSAHNCSQLIEMPHYSRMATFYADCNQVPRSAGYIDMPPLLKSCCCWRSLREGCIAIAVYTGSYFAVSCFIMLNFIFEERLNFTGNNTVTTTVSFLETGAVSFSTKVFTFAVLIIGTIGFISTIFLFIGLIKNNKYYLLPWIATMCMDAFMELVHCIYIFFIEKLKFNPVTAIIFTIDFFLVIFHTYALLCVISQYQHYSNTNGPEHERIINGISQGPSAESRIANITSTVTSTQGIFEATPIYYSTFDLEAPRSSSFRKKGLRPNKGVSFADETITDTNQ